jgi:hypothetical protein
MIQIDYPSYSFRFKEENKKELIFDEIRKLWVRLTPEEWVRQNFIQYLIQIKKYPSALFGIEKEIKLGELKKRCDIVIYKNAQPWMIIECKETNVNLNDITAQQILGYNMALKASYLILTNGHQTFGLETATQLFLSTLPDY